MKIFAAIAAATIATALPASAGSFVAFAVANTYCQKRELGMPMQDAMNAAYARVMSNPLYDQDWLLPNFANVVTNEVISLCPQYLGK